MSCFETVQLVVILAAAFALVPPAIRHCEWRGGLLALACIFFSAAFNELDLLWIKIRLPVIEELELIPICTALIGAAVCVCVWRGSSLVALRVIVRNRRFPLLVWGLLFVSIFPNVAQNKDTWELLAPAIEDTHALREFAKDITKFVGHLFLLNWAVLFLKDKHRVLGHRPSHHEHLLWQNQLVEIGCGTRRVAYRIGNTGFCVKFYYPQEQCTEKQKMQKSIQRDVGWRRFNKIRNSSSEEVFVYNRFRHKMPAEVREKMPAVCERVFHPKWGWGVLETYYTNPDGTAIVPYEQEIARQKGNPAVQEKIYRQARDLLLVLIGHRAYFHEPGNFHVQMSPSGEPTLKLIDFEPESKTFIPLEMWIPILRARKLTRKAKRYLRHIRKRYGIDVPVETEIG